MTRTVKFYHEQTGLLLSHTLTASNERDVGPNTPAGHKAIDVPKAGLDHLSQRVDVATGAVVDYQPPQPSDDHEWNHVTKRWDLNHAALERLHLANERRLRIDTLTKQKPDLVGDVLLDKPGALAKLRAADTEIELLRAQL